MNVHNNDDQVMNLPFISPKFPSSWTEIEMMKFNYLPLQESAISSS